jgi:hypothetical protein
MIPKTFVFPLFPAICQNIPESLPGDLRLQTILSYLSAENLNDQHDPLEKTDKIVAAELGSNTFQEAIPVGNGCHFWCHVNTLSEQRKNIG